MMTDDDDGDDTAEDYRGTVAKKDDERSAVSRC